MQNITNEPSDSSNRYLLLKIMTLYYYLSCIQMVTRYIRFAIFMAVEFATVLLGYDTA